MLRRDFLASSAAVGLSLRCASQVVARQPQQTSTASRVPKLNPPQNGPILVAYAISRRCTWIDWVGPQAVFETWHFDHALKRHSPRFKQFTVSERREPVDSLIPDYTFETAPLARIVVVPAQMGSPALHEWLRAVQKTADVTMSVCIGARHLAKAGLLDGQRATTHHGAIDQFMREFPKVQWVRGVRFVEGEKVSTAGGLTAGIDLALRVVERYFGRASAQDVADHLEYQSRGWIV